MDNKKVKDAMFKIIKQEELPIPTKITFRAPIGGNNYRRGYCECATNRFALFTKKV